MKYIFYLVKCFFLLLTHKPLKTIYFNYKMLPIKQAIYLPIFIYSKIEFRSLHGRIVINGKIRPNMIHIGDNTRYVTTSRPLSIWTINGTIIFEGSINFYQGTYVYVAQNGILHFGTKGTFIGSDTRIICRNRIDIGNTVEITWGNQIYDTSFHYISKDNQEPKSLTKSIFIGDNVWIGNRTTISKGAVIPQNSIIASNSIVNKDLSTYGENCMFAGSPADIKFKNIQRIFDYSKETEFDTKYNYIRYKL